MRRNYNILWLDDAFAKTMLANEVEHYKKGVEKHLQNLGYIPNIITITNKEEVTIELAKNKKIDLFISDYNIDDDYKGIDFLREARKEYNQEMILYSNVSENDIKEHIVKHLQDDTLELYFMSKFIFQSASNRKVLINVINEIIDSTLIRWKELNALRGFYLAETSQIHEELKNYVNNLTDYSDIIRILNINKNERKLRSRCIKLIGDINNGTLEENLDFYDYQLMLFEYGDDDFDVFDKVRNIRNKFAHVKEIEDSNRDVYIELNDGTKIYEAQISIYRKLLFDFCDKVTNKYLVHLQVTQ